MVHDACLWQVGSIGRVIIEREISVGWLKGHLLQSLRSEVDGSVYRSMPRGWKKELQETGRRRPQMLFMREGGTIGVKQAGSP